MKHTRRVLALALVVLMLLCNGGLAALGEALLKLPAALKSVGEEAFYGDRSIERVVLPDGATTIGARAFASSSLTEIYIPGSMREIADSAFDNHSASLVIKGPAGGIAESFAARHNIPFVATDAPLDILYTQDWITFANATAEMIRDYENHISIDSADETYSSGRLIVKVDGDLPDISAFDPQAIVRDPENHYVIQFNSDIAAAACADYLLNQPNVIYAEADQIVFGDDMSTADYDIQSYSWGVSATKADAYAADLKRRNATQRVVVAVVDTGVDASHPMLKGRLGSGYDFIDGDGNPQDGHGHGTHVSGTIIDCTPSLNVFIMPVRVLGNDGGGTFTTVANGIRYAASSKANVINLSLGGGHSHYIDDAISYALSQGCTVIVAAGNENDNTANHCPAHIQGCITVAAVNSSRERASFSNYGNAVDIAAPGVNIQSAIPGGRYGTKSGTSMATPHVSAAAAMLLCDPAVSSSQVETLLRNAATDLGERGWDPYYGAGFLNLEPFVKSGPEKYTIAYNSNGGTGAPSSQTKLQGVDLTLSSTKPTKVCTVTLNDGNGGTETRQITSTFTGWNTAANGTGTAYASGATYTRDAAATLYAQWRDGTLGTLPSPSRTGYVFEGWYTASSGGSAVSASTKVTNSMTIYAHWRPLSSYTIIYNANGGTGAPGNQTKYEDISLTLSAVKPTRSHTVTLDYGTGQKETRNVGATFDSWNTAANGTGTRYLPGAAYTRNDSLILYAQWTYGTMGALPTPTRDGYRFDGWFTAATGGSAVNANTAVTGNMTIYAHWQLNATFTITYDANGGTGAPGSQTKYEGITLKLSATKPTRAHTVTLDYRTGKKETRTISATFKSWNTKADGKGTSYASGANYTADAAVTLYAQWTYGAVGELPSPTRDGYAFEGWFTAASGGSAVNANTAVSGNMTIYAHWIKEGVSLDGTTLKIFGNGNMDEAMLSEIDFYKDSGVTNVVIGDGITDIGKSAFGVFRTLKTITIPDSVTSIRSNAFFYCTSLTSITIPDSVTSIGGYAFYGCNSLTIYGKESSYAMTYAQSNRIPFVAVGSGQPSTDPDPMQGGSGQPSSDPDPFY